MTSNADFTETAESLIAEGRVDEAKALLDERLVAIPASWSWLVDRGVEREIAFWSEAEYEAYRAYFGPRLATGLQVTWVGPSYPKACFLAAGIAAQSGRTDDATVFVERGLALEPDHPQLLLRLAALRDTDGRTAEALALADSAASARSWSPREDTAAARDAATRYRLRLAAPANPAGISAPNTSGPKRTPTFATFDDDGPGSGDGLLSRFVGRLESTTARILVVVAGFTTVVLFVVLLMAIFRTPPDVARVERFRDSLESYLALANTEPAPTRPYRRGKVVVLDLGSRQVDPITHLLAPAIRAESPADVGTIVIVQWLPEYQNAYYSARGQALAGAYVTNAHLAIVDATTGKRVGIKTIRGESPPETVARSASGREGEYGPRPISAVVDYVQSLPIFDADGDTIAVAGSTGDPGRPVLEDELSDVAFRSVVLDGEGRVTERPSGKARVFRELLPGGPSFEVVAVPAGSYRMGLADDDVTFDEFCRPGHEVAVPAFYLARTEVTRDLWRAVAALPRISRDLPVEPQGPSDGLLPVTSVSWADANEFCLRLEKATGRPYRLPTEAEWEYACLGGGAGPYATGAAIDATYSNVRVDPEDPESAKGPFRGKPTPVGSLGVANRFGLYDIDGNVAEWCADTFHVNYVGAPADGSAWTTGSSDTKRVLRGGAFDVHWTDASARKRFGFDPMVRYAICGMRIALSAPPQTGVTNP
ncbi:MAG: formylglycine-generating enzyme family protein [Blastocatellia bacterium]|nr:formylglycine-generating enzyme family protein [Blastocatellia bacterium]